jgi:hypothetical protein
MSFTFEIAVFKDLLQTYTTWNQLKTYLESEAGGLFRVVDTAEDGGLCLIRYDKGVSNMSLPHSKWFRSVVWDVRVNRPVCIAPCKTSNGPLPYRTLDAATEAGVVCQENLEGFMVNCFLRKGDTALHITTRSKLDATGTFYSTKTFRQLFCEAYADTYDLEDASEERIQASLEDLKDAEDVAVCYSFLVQHREHRIVQSDVSNRVYLIYKGLVHSDGSITVEDTPATCGGKENVCVIPMDRTLLADKTGGSTYAQVVARRLLQEEQGQEKGQGQEPPGEVEEWAKKFISSKSRDFLGLICKDRAGNRWRFRSDKYSAIRSLRGNSPSVRDRFCQLYTSNLLHQYLEYYPEDSWEMSVCLMHMNAIIKMMYNLYVELHIRKTRRIDSIDKMFHPHLYKIQGIYLTQLLPAKKTMNLHEVQLYLHKQPWQRLSFLIRNTVGESAGTGEVA